MTDDEPNQEPEPTETLPKTGLRVPVPKRKDVMDAILKVSEPDEQDEPSRPPAPESARPE
jgi:hypothetical protein